VQVQRERREREKSCHYEKAVGEREREKRKWAIIMSHSEHCDGLLWEFKAQASSPYLNKLDVKVERKKKRKKRVLELLGLFIESFHHGLVTPCYVHTTGSISSQLQLLHLLTSSLSPSYSLFIQFCYRGT
jgi:hypothetical protein